MRWFAVALTRRAARLLASGGLYSAKNHAQRPEQLWRRGEARHAAAAAAAAATAAGHALLMQPAAAQPLPLLAPPLPLLQVPPLAMQLLPDAAPAAFAAPL
jgi:hypothetical protein